MSCSKGASRWCGCWARCSNARTYHDREYNLLLGVAAMRRVLENPYEELGLMSAPST